METSVMNGMCRCCASEGAFKDVKSSYHWMGQEEVYGDMLRECFDISLSISEGEQGSICELCITQLRNAVNFKKQVLHTEDQFKTQLQNKLFKPSIVKVELPADDINDSGDNLSADEDYSGPEFEVPIKTETPDEPKVKKRAAKATTSRAKRAKTNAGETSTKRVQQIGITNDVSDTKTNLDQWKVTITKTAEVKKQSVATSNKYDLKPLPELEKHRSNIRMILQFSNATPIRCYSGIGFGCCFCTEQYPHAPDLKRHTIQEHDNKVIVQFMQKKTMHSYFVKLDITSLRCTLCDTAMNTVEELINHLINIHGKTMYTDIKNHIMCFKFDGKLLRCIFCSVEFNRFKGLLEHMNKHYRNFICDVCDSGFINQRILSTHAEAHKTGTFKCDKCPKVFDTMRKKKSHEKSVHVFFNMMLKCGYCGEKFKSTRNKELHLMKVHGVQLQVIKCGACDKTFQTKNALRIHTKRDHLMDRRFKCDQCDKEFFGSVELRLHMVKHSGLREFECDVCHKAYGRLKTLREHMRIHMDDRRFKCEHCGQTFVQKCSWRGHMRNRHGEIV